MLLGSWSGMSTEVFGRTRWLVQYQTNKLHVSAKSYVFHDIHWFLSDNLQCSYSHQQLKPMSDSERVSMQLCRAPYTPRTALYLSKPKRVCLPKVATSITGNANKLLFTQRDSVKQSISLNYTCASDARRAILVTNWQAASSSSPIQTWNRDYRPFGRGILSMWHSRQLLRTCPSTLPVATLSTFSKRAHLPVLSELVQPMSVDLHELSVIL